MRTASKGAVDGLLDDVQDGAKLLVHQLSLLAERLKLDSIGDSPWDRSGTATENIFFADLDSDGIARGASEDEAAENRRAFRSVGSGHPSRDHSGVSGGQLQRDDSGKLRSEDGSSSLPARIKPIVKPISLSDCDGIVPMERDPVVRHRPLMPAARRSVGQQAVQRAMEARRNEAMVSQEVTTEMSDPPQRQHSPQDSRHAKSLSFNNEVEKRTGRVSRRHDPTSPRISGHSNASSDKVSMPFAAVLDMRPEWKTLEEAELIAQHAVDTDGEVVRGISKDTVHIRFHLFAQRHPGTASAESPQMLDSEGSRSWACTWVIHPRSRQRLLWDILSIAFIVHDIVTLPMYAADMRDTRRFVVLNYLCAFFWQFDMVMSSRTGFFDGPMYERGTKICIKHYLRSWFTFDLCIIVPEWLMLLLTLLHVKTLDPLIRVLWMCPLARVVKIPMLLGRLENCTVSSYESLAFSLLRIVSFLLILVHILSCGWYAIGASRHGRWVQLDSALEIDPELAVYYKYVASARWVLSQINGRTDMAEDTTILERLYTVLCAFIAVVVMSIFISSITTTMLELEKVMSEATRNSRLLDSYLRRHGRERSNTAFYARTYFKKVSHMQKDKEFEELALGVLPRNVQRDLLYEVRHPMLVKHDFFHEVNTDFQRAMKSICCYAVKTLKVRSMEMLFEKDDVCERMLFMERGECRYSTGDSGASKILALAASAKSRSFASMIHANSQLSLEGYTTEHGVDPEALGDAVRKGMWISEPALWIAWINRGELIARTDSSLLAVEANKFAEVVKMHKELDFRVQIYAQIFRTKFLESASQTNDLIMEPLVHDRIQSIVHSYGDALGSGSKSMEVSFVPLAAT